ncbi:anthranilate phosphoribosyltransferase [Suttonella ornithocola]|uniref:Anthranilate phosphoribosyltransferase n=1 Tax=Suttonella ornithocola TaxID=279832 RepID=A0A380N0Y3_9GAMM|nr:anthranilate phosphoribosyltransferase [Suttonella ornithocola]SUO97417.1 Anthranilate phosphoribosyltransferase [Suttonella ornithocola]
MKAAIGKLVARKDLSSEEMQAVISSMMQGEQPPELIAAFLTALAMKGETVEEVTAAAKVMRQLAKQVYLVSDEIMVDPVGTGGDGVGLFNCSTASAIIASAGGVKIAKHGNIAASSASGSADVLREAGVKLELSPEQVVNAVNLCGFGFMYAPAFHAAMRHVAPVRRAIGIRTIFNVLGPLSNPAGVKHQVLGVFAKDWVRPMTEVSKNLGAQSVITVCSANGLDEFAITDINFVCELCADGTIIEYEIDPVELGIKHRCHDCLKVSNAKESLSLIQAIFRSEGPKEGEDMLALNAAAIFKVAGRVKSWQEGIMLAKQIIQDGRALSQLTKIAKISQLEV